MLADHLAGIPSNAFYEFYFLNSFHESLGLPPILVILNIPELIESLLSKEPVAPINSRPIYSQLSFTLFALCLEAHTGNNYSQILDETIYKPLNLVNSGVSPGTTERVAVPQAYQPGEVITDSTPRNGGGLYSSTNDLSIFLSAILNHSILDTPANVRKWLKPLPAHTVDIYAKSGGAMGYMAQVAVIDQYGVCLIVLTAGPVDAMNILYRAILGTFIPAIEEEARFQSRRYAGTWTSKTSPPSNGSQTHSDEKIKLTLDIDDGTGIRLASFTRGNASIVNVIKEIWDAEYLALGFGILPDILRVYPTDFKIPVAASEVETLLAQSIHIHSFATPRAMMTKTR
ncbi:serine hydrolase domain-containing protein [Aspergillus foveolatus]|uniref:serine hydrolase domain-containing protein n=1 Tax=Aspergillus foveolatus TaxID=210207 RepID=UPI003CCCC672